jgi:hypothetical protein
MRKRIIPHPALLEKSPTSEQGWLDLQNIVTVEVTSEDPGFPIESAFNFEHGLGWRAAWPGDQQIRIVFDHPTPIRRIQLHFVETEMERTQEFTLRWSSINGGPTEIVRQQWNFSPTGSTRELEDYQVSLEAVSTLELAIKPDLSGKNAVAALAMWRMA